MMTHNVKIINYIYIKLYLLLYHLILPIRHGGPFVAIFRDDEAIAVPGWEDFLLLGMSKSAMVTWPQRRLFHVEPGTSAPLERKAAS